MQLTHHLHQAFVSTDRSKATRLLQLFFLYFILFYFYLFIFIYFFLFFWHFGYEPAHDKTYNKTFATREDSNQPAHSRSLIRIFADHMCLLQPPGYKNVSKKG